MHLGTLSHVLAARYGDRPAVEEPTRTPGFDHGRVRSFRAVEDAVARLAALARRRGLVAEQRVAILVDNRVDVVLHLLAVARAGGVPVPVNHRLSPTELARVLGVTGTRLAIADPGLVDRLPGDVEVVDTDTIGAHLRAAPIERLAPDPTADADATAVVLTTSGTTGQPGAAALSSRGLVASIGWLLVTPFGSPWVGRRGRDRMLAALPLTHVMGLSTLLVSWTAGVPLLRRTRFDADEFLDLIVARRPNVVTGVPTMYADLEAAGAATRDLSSVQLWVSSADVMPPERARRFQHHGALGRVAGHGVGRAVFLDVFGMVELSGPAAIRVYPPSVALPVAIPSFAVTLPGMQVRAVDDDGEPVGPGRVGRLQWRGPGVLRDGHGRAASADGWFTGGDRGRVWPGGVFRFAGRDHDRLKVGGFSVFPAEVEEELHGGPRVRDVAVVGVPDERLGDRPVAVVVPEEGFDAVRFLAWAHDEVAGYRRPAAVVLADELPRGTHGKVDRGAARRFAIAALGAGDATELTDRGPVDGGAS